MPQHITFKMVTSAIKFSGGKQEEYLGVINQSITENMVLEMRLDYAKGRHSWGAHNQKISVKEFIFIPRYQLSHDVSISFGVVTQPQTEFRNNQRFEFTLLKNPKWVINIVIDDFTHNHYLEWSASSQKWSTSIDLDGVFENGSTNNKIGLRYKGYF